LADFVNSELLIFTILGTFGWFFLLRIINTVFVEFLPNLLKP
jgi:hypothetical protein